MIKIYKVNKEHPNLLDQLNQKHSCGTILVYSENCPHCVSMKPHWEKMKQKMYNKSANIYEINSDDLQFINHPIKNVVDGFPTILNVNDRNITQFENERTLDNLVNFVESNVLKLKPEINKKLYSKISSKKKRNKHKKNKKTKKKVQNKKKVPNKKNKNTLKKKSKRTKK